MTKRTLISTAELKRLAEVANSEGVTVELEREGTLVRVMPFHPSQMISRKPTKEDKSEAALAKWIADREVRRAKTGL